MESFSTFGWIVLTCVVGGVASVSLAALFALSARAHWIPSLVSFAVGALLGAAFLEILPHAFEHGDTRVVAATILGGILAFFVLEKLVLWRHSHAEDWETGEIQEAARPLTASHGHSHGHAGHDHGRSGMLILIGDSFHNFVDGILIAAAFIESVPLGIVTAAAVIAHEIPQEIGDFVILLHSGYSRMRAFMYNLISSFAMLAGAMLAYFSLQSLQSWINPALALAAASMIYVAVADLIPGLHRRAELKSTLQQVLLIAAGVLSIVAAGELTH
jgi:zinc and cadmium transporter